MSQLTIEEAGLILQWIGKEMFNDNVIAAATVQFREHAHKAEELADFLIENDIDEDRASELTENVDLDELIGFDLQD